MVAKLKSTQLGSSQKGAFEKEAKKKGPVGSLDAKDSLSVKWNVLVAPRDVGFHIAFLLEEFSWHFHHFELSAKHTFAIIFFQQAAVAMIFPTIFAYVVALIMKGSQLL